MRTSCFLALVLAFVMGLVFAGRADAQTVSSTCAPAATQGTAPADFKTYCWFDFTGYNDAAAQGGGQPFSFRLPDGSTLSMTVSTTSNTTATPALTAVAAPAWSGAAIGNSAFSGIPGKPVLYLAQNGSTGTVTLSNITFTSPSGAAGTGGYAIIAGDGESTNNGESLSFTTNATGWTQLAQVQGTGGSTYYPTVGGLGTGTVTETGTQAGNAGAFVFGSTGGPTTVSVKLVGSGLQGAMFGVRFASISVTAKMAGARISNTDQFTYAVQAAAAGKVIASQTSTGTGNGPFTVASAPTIPAGYPIYVTEAMASGSANPLAYYTTSLTCTNANTSSTTPMPTNVSTASYQFPALKYGDAVSCTFTNTPLPVITVSGTVYNDANHNGVLDNNETGTGVTNLSVKLTAYSGGACSTTASATAAVNTTTGAYSIANVTPGTYCLVLSTGTGTTNVAPAIPAGWVGTQAASGVIQITVARSPLGPQNFGLFNGASVAGTVFADTGVGGGAANNGTQDGAEAGISGVAVNAVQGGTAVAGVATAGDGSFVLWVPAGASTTLTPTAPSGYLATGGNRGTTSGSYTRPSITFTPVAGTSYTGIAFGLIPPSTLSTDNTRQAAPGTVLFFPHTFVAGSAGTVLFSTNAAANPAVTGWNEQIYLDAACSGTIAASDTQLTAAMTVTAGQTVCILVKENVPAAAANGSQNQVTVSAKVTYTGSAAPAAVTLTRVDLTIVGVGDLQVTKLVSDLTTGGAFATSNSANPGDTLRYRLTVTNVGAKPATNLVVNDSVPSLTGFVAAACPAASALPAGLTACAVGPAPATGGTGALSWQFTGSLAPGAAVMVTFDVTVNN